MDLGSLKKLIAEVRKSIGDRRLILFGSSSLFASFQRNAPEEIGVETTLDADFFLDPDDEACRAELLTEFGREREYHITHGFYGDFVDLRLADAFPDGWRDRLVPMPGFENVVALHPMDMAVSKVNATARSCVDRRLGRREADRGLKDINTLVTLIRAGHIDVEVLAEKVFQLDQQPAFIAECSRVMQEIRARI